MTGFLDHLAGMALGAKQAGAARLSLPPRFAPASSLIAHPEQDLAAVAESATSQPPRAILSLPVERAQDRAEGELAGFRKLEAFVDRPADRPDGERPVARPAASDAPEARSGPAAAFQALPSGPPVAAERLMRSDTGAPPSPVTIAAAASQPVPRAMPMAASPRPRSEPQRLPLVTQAAPLSSAIVAGRSAAAREARPVINVTIDRMEVRAPAAQTPGGEQRRARSQPTISLSDYLRESGRGGRQ